MAILGDVVPVVMVATLDFRRLRYYTERFEEVGAVSKPTDIQRRTVHYRGMVQGVGFRYTARRIALRFPVAGYVQNLADGRVLLMVEGERGQLDGYLAAVSQSLGDYIVEAEVQVGPPEGKFRGFDIRF